MALDEEDGEKTWDFCCDKIISWYDDISMLLGVQYFLLVFLYYHIIYHYIYIPIVYIPYLGIIVPKYWKPVGFFCSLQIFAGLGD